MSTVAYRIDNARRSRDRRADHRQPARQCDEHGGARRPAGRGAARGGRCSSTGGRRDRRQRPLHPRRRHQGVRQADHRPERPRRHRGDRRRRQAGRRRAGRQCARRRARDRARLPLARRETRRQARPARSEYRSAAGCRRHAAFAALDRCGGGARHDHHRQADRRPQGARARCRRRSDRRRSAARRSGLRAPRARREATAAQSQRAQRLLHRHRRGSLRASARKEREEMERPARPVAHRRLHRGRMHAQLRRRLRARARRVRGMQDQPAARRVDLPVQRRARRRQGARPLGGPEAAADPLGRGDRRRHDGRRHRDVLRERRHSGAPARRKRRWARPRPRADRKELRDLRLARQPHAAEDGPRAVADHRARWLSAKSPIATSSSKPRSRT